MDIKELFKVMVESEASDLYLTVARPPMYRIEGKIRPIGDHAFTPPELETLVKSVMSDAQLREYGENLEFKMAMSKRGLVLVVGATGSGKSTTLAAMVDHRNATESGHIITIEDPIEFVHRHKKSIVTQREVGFDTHSFQSALKNTLRQAPDVILIGEIRDTETMEAAVTFAETGHLCLGTLHSNNANQAIERIMNFFPLERHAQIYLQLSLNLRSIISQRLIPSPDGKRVVALEILVDTPRVRDLVKKGDVDILKEAMEQGVQEGCQTFDQALFMLYKVGKISLDQALINADSANNLRLKIKLAGLKGDEETDPLQQPVNGNGREDSKVDAAKSNAAFRLRKT